MTGDGAWSRGLENLNIKIKIRTRHGMDVDIKIAFLCMYSVTNPIFINLLLYNIY